MKETTTTTLPSGPDATMDVTNQAVDNKTETTAPAAPSSPAPPAEPAAPAPPKLTLWELMRKDVPPEPDDDDEEDDTDRVLSNPRQSIWDIA